MSHIQPETHLPTLTKIRIYTALLTQVGTEAPTAIVLQNTTGRTITWTRTDVGEYAGTLSTDTDQLKTTVMINGGLLNGWSFAARMELPNKIHVTTGMGAVRNDELLYRTTIEIKIYS